MTTVGTEGERAANALTVPAFRLLWLNNIAFFLFGNALRFAFGWVVLDLLLRDEGSQGLALFALGAPILFFVLPAGIWADRWNRKRLLIGTQLASAATMALTAVLIGRGVVGPGGAAADVAISAPETITDPGAFDTGYGWVLVLTVLAGIASTIGNPVRSALIPALVRRDQLFGAIALNAIAMTMSMILGPVLVKVVGDRVGFDGAFWFLAALLVVGTAVLLPLTVPDHEPDDTPRRPGPAEVGVAVRHIVHDRQLRTLFGLLLLSSLTVSPAILITLQAHVKEELGRTAGDAALPFALMGLGMAISSAFLMRHGDMRNKGAVFQRAMMCGSTVTTLVGLTDSYTAVVVLGFFMGLAGGFFINMNQGLIQSSTPQPMMGRVMAVYTLVNNGVTPIGGLVLGLAAAATGTGVIITAAGATCLVLVVWTYVRNADLRRLT